MNYLELLCLHIDYSTIKYEAEAQRAVITLPLSQEFIYLEF